MEIELTDAERWFLVLAIHDWGGPAHPTDELARAMGFADTSDLRRGRHRIRDAIEDSNPLDEEDWERALMMAELVFVSDVFGSGQDFCATTGLTDDEAIGAVRSAQRKIRAVTGGRGPSAPVSYGEFLDCADSRHVVRGYRAGRCGLDTLLAGLTRTLDSFEADLVDFRAALANLDTLRDLPEADQRSAAESEIRRLEATLTERLGSAGRHGFWLTARGGPGLFFKAERERPDQLPRAVDPDQAAASPGWVRGGPAPDE
jgi:hypothetical protein